MIFRHKKLLLIGLLVIAIIVGLGLFAQKATAPGGLLSRESGESTKEEEIPSFDKSKLSTSDPASIWVVVNKNLPLSPLTYEPADLVSVGNNHRLRQEAATALAEMMAAAKSDGHTLIALSGYRSYARQQTVYNNEVRTYGQAVADTQSAKPGHSEHQTGWAIDVGGGGCNLDDCFGNTAEGKWVATNAYRYGFIVRYVPGKEVITGYRAEPWHLRYIGTELAAEMHENSIQTLEEFFGL